MPVCEKCGCKCDQVFRGHPYVGIEESNVKPNSPAGRGYYLVCESCLRAGNRVNSDEYASANTVGLFFLQLLIFAAPGFAICQAVNEELGIIVAVAGLAAYFFLRKKKPKIVKIINAIAIILFVLAIILF